MKPTDPHPIVAAVEVLHHLLVNHFTRMSKVDQENVIYRLTWDLEHLKSWPTYVSEARQEERASKDTPH